MNTKGRGFANFFQMWITLLHSPHPNPKTKGKKNGNNEIERQKQIKLTFWGILQASTTTIIQSASTAAFFTFFIIMLSNVCISFCITPGVSYSIICTLKP